MADPTNVVSESDSDPLNEDNVAVFVGAYATSTTILVPGGSAADSVTLTYPAASTGNVTLAIVGSAAATSSDAYRSTAQFRVRTHGGDDSVKVLNAANLTARPMMFSAGLRGVFHSAAWGCSVVENRASFNPDLKLHPRSARKIAMAVTVVLDEELVGQLQPRADAVQASVRDFAVRILQDAVLRPAESKDWKTINARRLDLIAMEYSQGLSTAEAQELDALQEVVSKASEPEDQRLLKMLGGHEQKANSLFL